MKIQNPVLRGFHPDPSVIRVDFEDGPHYYIATSTFEWWPGVRIHHSTDLMHWELMPYPLTRISQLDLTGVGASQGVWAPCLTYEKGTFYLVYTVVSAFYCNMYDTANYLVTAEDMAGPWSDPVPLNRFGFDPSLFHDEDGKKYMVSMVTDHRIPKKYKGRIVLQEYDPVNKCMTGPVRDIFRADRIFLEGPHIFKRHGFYYLFCADTGTGEGHGQSILRSASIWGPYEMYQPDYGIRQSEDEAYSILTARHSPAYPLQKTGHCDLVETKDGAWFAVLLCGRPLENRNPENALKFPGERRYPLGRETSIVPVEWTEDGWLRLSNHTVLADLTVDLPDHCFNSKEKADQGEAGKAEAPQDGRDDFNETALKLDYQSLRVPMDETHLSLTARPGYLRMYGREGLASRFHQTLAARRITEFDFAVSACVEFEPEVFKQMAGLICMYDDQNYYYLHLTWDEDGNGGGNKCISILSAGNKQYDYPVGFCPVEPGCPVFMKAEIHDDELQFFYGYEDGVWQKIGPVLDFSRLSDEACVEGWFTGAMAGICCQDLTGFGKHADFDWFECGALSQPEKEV